jgi:GNAT superfamily N-acetyltransferase
MIKIIPLSKELLNEAIILIETVFPVRSDQKGAKWSFTDSLKHPNSDKEYWLAVNPKGEVLGVTGLYHYDRDKNIVWLGWYGVHPLNRGHGIGSMLLEFAISEAKRRGFSILKLYSSFDENERAAHYLFRKFGFKELESDKRKDKIIFEKKLR